MAIRIFLASNFRLLLQGLEALLARHPDRFSLAGSAESLADLPARLAAAPADLLVLDIDSAPSSQVMALWPS